jgi:ankyrin repeat protein
MNGHKAMVELLLAHGADPTVKSGDGETPLHQAAEKGFPAVAQVLLAHGADGGGPRRRHVGGGIRALPGVDRRGPR